MPSPIIERPKPVSAISGNVTSTKNVDSPATTRLYPIKDHRFRRANTNHTARTTRADKYIFLDWPVMTITTRLPVSRTRIILET